MTATMTRSTIAEMHYIQHHHVNQEAFCGPAYHDVLSACVANQISLKAPKVQASCITIASVPKTVAASLVYDSKGSLPRQSIAAARTALLKSHLAKDAAMPTTKAHAVLQAIDTGLSRPCSADRDDQLLARFRAGVRARMPVAPPTAQCGL